MKKIIVSLFVFLSALHITFAEGLDYKASANVQSYPLGTMVTGILGYGKELWRGENEFMYGYVRPYVQLDSVGIINRPYVGIQVFPISILGFSTGQGFSQRNTKSFTDFDCQQIVCDQTLRSQFVQVNTMIGYGDVLLDLKGRQEWFRESGGVRPFYEEMSYLVGAPGADQLKSLTAILGYRYSEQISVGVMGLYNRFEESQNDNASMFGLVNYSHGDWRYTAGLGQYKSSHQDSNLSAVVRVQWIGLKSLAFIE